MASETNLRIRFLVNEDGDLLSERCGEFLDEMGVPYFEHSNDDRKLLEDYFGCYLYVKEEPDVGPSDHSLVLLSVRCEFVTDGGGILLDDIISFVAALCNAIEPEYVFGMHTSRVEAIDAPYDPSIPSPVDDDGLAQHRINHPTWLMLFTPAMVEEYGRDWLLQLPADRIEELDDGSILVVATEDVPDCETDHEITELMNDAMAPLESAFDQHEL